MKIFKNNKKVGLFADVIRCDEPTYLIWKWRPDGKQLGEDKREYAIRWGSQLRVKDGEVAVFVYKQKDGTMQDYIVGPFDQKIETKNFPVLSSILGVFMGGDTPFQAEVYFINLAHVIQSRFGVPYFDVYDPRYPDFAVPVAVRGMLTFKISDYRRFIKLHRLHSFDLNVFQNQIKDAISRYVKDTVVKIPAIHNIPVVQIESKVGIINDDIEFDIKERLSDNFGVDVSGVDISSIEIDKYSEGYHQLMGITKDIVSGIARAEADVKVRDIYDKQRIESDHYEETLRVQREEGQYAQHMHTRTANIGAYQIEKQTEVGVAGAQALGQMGANGAGDINLGGCDGGFNPASLMANMALGNVVGQSIAHTMTSAMSGINNQTPPPIPNVAYNVAKDGKPTGPFDVTTLSTMAAMGELKPDSLVWKQGMSNWVRADSLDELKGIFPPPIV